jgi:hypothetical protein
VQVPALAGVGQAVDCVATVHETVQRCTDCWRNGSHRLEAQSEFWVQVVWQSSERGPPSPDEPPESPPLEDPDDEAPPEDDAPPDDDAVPEDDAPPDDDAVPEEDAVPEDEPDEPEASPSLPPPPPLLPLLQAAAVATPIPTTASTTMARRMVLLLLPQPGAYRARRKRGVTRG